MRRRNLLKLAAAGAVGTYVATLPASPAAAAALSGRDTTGYWPAGDSITEGLFGSSTQDGYRSYLADQLTADAIAAGCGWYYVGSRVTGSRQLPHDGWGGKLTAEVAAHIPASFGSVAPRSARGQVVLWHTGTNDLNPPDGSPDRSAQQMLDDTSAALDRIHLAGPDVKVLVAQIQHPTRNDFTPAMHATIDAYDDAIPALCASKGDWCRPVEMRGIRMPANDVHPGDDGYHDLADRWHAALQAAGWLPGFNGDVTISLFARVNNQYVTAEQAGTQPMIANRTSIGAWERFTVDDLGGGWVALRANINNRYVTAPPDGSPMNANRTVVGAWEKFQLAPYGDGSYAIKAGSNNLWVTAEQAGSQALRANRSVVGAWEKFDIWQQR